MRVVVQRVSSAQVSIEGEILGKIGKGLVINRGITQKGTNGRLLN